MSDKVRILVVEDDPVMQRLLASHLEARGYEVGVAGEGWQALQAARDKPPHVVLVDITLPGAMDGLEVCRRIRASSQVPIILVTAAQRPETKVIALDNGADDYLVKPFDAEELLARIRAVLRRARQEAPALPVAEVDGLTIDFARRELRSGSHKVHLTRTEFDLLEVFVRNADRTLSYAQMLEAVWGPGYDDVRSVHAHLSHLRRKLSVCPAVADRIVAVPGVGYRFRMTA